MKARVARPRVLLLLFAVVLAGTCPTSAADDDAFAVVRTLGERPTAGRVVGLGPAGLVLAPSGGGAERTIALDGLRAVRFSAPHDGATEARHRVTLVGGEVLVGRIRTADEIGLTIEVPAIGPVEVVFDVLASVEVLEEDDPCLDLADRYGPDETGDVAHLRASGDRFVGILLTADDERIVMENERGRKQPIEWAALRVLHLENDPVPAPEGIRTEIELAGGSRLACATPPALVEGALSFALRSLPDQTLSVALRAVRALRFAGGRFVYASDLPFESTYTPYYPVPEGMAFGDLEGRRRFWGARRDRRPSGCPLRVGGTTYRHGFAVHSKSVVRIALDGAYTSFEAAFGIDDEVKRSGPAEAEAARVDARVLADGEVVWKAEAVTLDSSPHKVGPVDVTGVETLELVVGFGEDSGPVGDDAAWVDPILVVKRGE